MWSSRRETASETWEGAWGELLGRLQGRGLAAAIFSLSSDRVKRFAVAKAQYCRTLKRRCSPFLFIDEREGEKEGVQEKGVGEGSLTWHSKSRECMWITSYHSFRYFNPSSPSSLLTWSRRARPFCRTTRSEGKRRDRTHPLSACSPKSRHGGARRSTVFVCKERRKESESELYSAINELCLCARAYLSICASAAY